MKFKLLFAGLAVAAVTVSSAVAAPPEGKGKPPTTGAGCKPKIMVVLKGTLTAAPLSVDVTKANRWVVRTWRALRPLRLPLTRTRRFVARARSSSPTSSSEIACSFRLGCVRPTSRTTQLRL